MAVNDSRSMNMDMRLGALDGKFKSVTPNRGGDVDPTAAYVRKEELNIQYNVQEPPASVMPESHLR